MFCNYCGKQIDDTAKFCNYCGKSLNSTENKIEIEKRDKETVKENKEDNGRNIIEILKQNKTYNITLKGSAKDAQEMLMNNETISYAFGGTLEIMATNQSLKTGIFDVKGKVAGVTVITDKRVYFCSNVLGQRERRELPLKEIISIDSRNTFGVGVLRIKGLTETLEVTVNAQIEKEVKSLIYEYKEKRESNEGNSNGKQSISVADEILKFKELLDQGIITQEEFENQKQNLLNLK